MRSFRGQRLSAGAMLLVLVVVGCPQSGPTTGPSPGPSIKTAAEDDTTNTPETATVPVPNTVASFRDRAARSGVSFTYRNGQEAGYFSIVESLGGGVGLLDWDRDGDLDLFLPAGGRFGKDETIGGRPAGLFLNRGDWSFLDSAVQAGTAGETAR